MNRRILSANFNILLVGIILFLIGVALSLFFAHFILSINPSIVSFLWFLLRVCIGTIVGITLGLAICIVVFD